MHAHTQIFVQSSRLESKNELTRQRSGELCMAVQKQDFIIQSLFSSDACIGLDPKIICAVMKEVIEAS